jgi:MFS family permease
MLLFALNLLNYIDRYVLSGALPLVKKAFPSATQEDLGGLALAFIWVYCLVSPLFGVLGDRVPHRRLLIGIGIQLWSLATAAASVVTSFAQLFVSRMFVGIGEAAYGTTAPTIIADLYPRLERGKALSFFYLAIPLGAALGYAIGGSVGSAWGWRSAFLVVGLPGLLIGLACYRLREPARGAAEDVGEQALRDYQARKASLRDYLHLMRLPSYLLNTLAMTAYTYAVGGIAFWLPEFAYSQRQIPLAEASLAFGAITAMTGIVGTLLGMTLADRLAAWNKGAYFLVCGVSMIAAAPLLFLGLRAESLIGFWAAITATELLLFMNTGPSNTIISNVTEPHVRTSAYAINIFLIHAGGDGLSPKIMGAIADRTNLTDAFTSTNFVIVLSGILWLIGTPFLDRDTQRVSHRISAKD